MPRRKIGADLKEALCKLYEAGDISADTIEKHGIMSRATFFRNLKIYKTGASLEQRHSTGRKTNVDKLKEQEKQKLDSLQPAHLSHLELVLLLDNDERSAQGLAARNKRKGKGAAPGGSKRRETAKGTPADGQASEMTMTGDDSGSESDSDNDEGANLASRQALDSLSQAAKSFLTASNSSAPSGSISSSDNFADLDSLLKPEDSHYSHSNRGALYIVRRKAENRDGERTGDIIAAIALRSLIWTPQIYQALGSSYASRSIDKICNLARLRVDPMWQRKGIGRWLVNAAELKASKLGFSHLYTQSDAHRAELLSFWRKTGFNEFARLDDVARLEKLLVATALTKDKTSSKRVARSPPASASTRALGATTATTSAAAAGEAGVSPETSAKKQWIETRHPTARERDSGIANPSASEIGPAIPLDPAMPLLASSDQSTPSAATATLPESLAVHPQTSLTAHLPSAAAAVPFPAGLSSSPALTLPGATAVPTSPSPTPSDLAQVVQGSPPRRIAFHEAESAGSRPAI